MPDVTLDHILDALDSARQRATYGAVAKVVGSTPRTLMKGRDRDRRHSWVVNRISGKPTGYANDDVHPELEANTHVVDSPVELLEWLAAAGAPVPASSR